MRASRSVVSAFLLAISVSSASAEPARVYAAGSLVAPLKQAIKAAGLDASQIADPVFGPSGGLRERIEKGRPPIFFCRPIRRIRARWQPSGLRH